MSNPLPNLIKNPWIKRYAKGIIAVATGVVALANVWTDGPVWLSYVASIASMVLVVMTPNAKKYKTSND